MANPTDKLFGKRGDAAKILAQVEGQVDGQAMSAEQLKKAQEKMAADSAANDMLEAAGCCEEVITYLNEVWNERGFTPEQRVFCIALVTVNLREHLPEDKGGKAMFDRVAYEAKKYYDSNKS